MGNFLKLSYVAHTRRLYAKVWPRHKRVLQMNWSIDLRPLLGGQGDAQGSCGIAWKLSSRKNTLSFSRLYTVAVKTVGLPDYYTSFYIMQSQISTMYYIAFQPQVKFCVQFYSLCRKLEKGDSCHVAKSINRFIQSQLCVIATMIIQPLLW